MLRSLYDWTMRQATHPKAPIWLFIISFMESSVFPIPPDAMLIPMALARPMHAYRVALNCTVASVLGGILGYGIGWLLFDAVAAPVIALYGYQEKFAAFQALYAEWGLWIILVKGLTPVPYKIITIASGVAGYNFPVFVAASIATRGARFFMLAWLIRRYGDPIRDFIERRLTLITSIVALLLIAIVAALRYL